ncbi:hypothetical protein [Legionella saoudiensis]|uniref:hypothetical protein n=1 Tax=Legionella saoudiensis TaxID=1750561 RepID=UPI0007316670|nr:hypothetical protein [Legionella saoudiensis]
MQFILVAGRVQKFKNLRHDYEERRQINLDKATTSWLTFFGATDVETRNRQISFLEKMFAVLEHFLHKGEQFTTQQEFQANLMASRIMIAACLCIQEEIKSTYMQHQIGKCEEKSALYQLINEYLGVTAENFLDNEDKLSCYETAYTLIKTQDVLTHLNHELQLLKHKEFTEAEWKLFSDFITGQEKKRSIPVPPSNYLPIGNAFAPVFGETFYYVGLTIGWVVAGAVSSSSAAITPRLEVTSWVSSALLFIGPTNVAGVALLAPTIASRLISTFCNFSFSSMSGKAGRFIGQVTGQAAGLPFDIAYNLLKATGSLLVHYSSQPPSLAPLDGICIAKGVPAVQGRPIQLNVVPQQLMPKPRLQITENGEITVDGKHVDEPVFDDKMALVIKELKEKLEPKTPSGPLIEELEESAPEKSFLLTP